MMGMRWPVQAPSDKGCFWKIDLVKYLKRFDLVIHTFSGDNPCVRKVTQSNCC